MSEQAPTSARHRKNTEQYGGIDELMAQLEEDFAAVESQGPEPQAADASKKFDEIIRNEILNDEPVALARTLDERPESSESQVEAASESEQPLEEPESELPTTVRHDIDYSEPLRLAFVSQEHDADVQARHEAIKRREAWSSESKTKIGRIVKGIWNNYVGDFKQLREQRKARDEIRENGDVFIDQDHDQARASLQATINRHTSNLENMIHRDRGESREDLDQNSELSGKVKDFIRSNIDGSISDEALREEVIRAVNAYGEGLDKHAFHENAMIADNLLAIRDAVVGAREHEGGMERALESLKISIGESRTGVNTEARNNWAENMSARLLSTRVGSLVKPEYMLVAATVAGSALRLGGTRLAASALTFVPGAAGAVFSGMRENRLVKDDRAHVARDMAQGRRAEAGSTRREQMESTVYEMAAAGDMAAELHALTGEDIDLDDNDALKAAFESIANVRARIKSSELKKIDLISYSEGRVEEEREALDLAYAYAKAAVRGRLENADTLRALGMPRHLEFDDQIERQADAVSETFEDDLDAKDRAFAKLKRRRVATAAAIGGATGLLLGTAAQEVYASFDPTRAGLIEQLWGAKTRTINGEVHHTLLDGLAQWQDSHEVSINHGPSSEYSSYAIGSNADHYSVSADHTLVDNGNGTINLESENGSPSVIGLDVHKDGSLTDGAIARLHEQGFKVRDDAETLHRDVTRTESSTVNQFLDHHNADVTKVTRDLWYDNDTPAPNFDQNELKLWWGGENGTDGHGGFQMFVSHMSENGSFHGDESAQWRELAAKGDLKLALSANTDSQDRVIMVDINRDGTINIPKDGPAAELFKDVNGQAVFEGKYAEVVQLRGEDASGTEHIAPLATLVGNDSLNRIEDTFTNRENFVRHNYTITGGNYTTTERVGDYTEMAPVIPVVGRNGIESLRRANPERKKIDEALVPYGYYNREPSPEEISAMVEERSPRLVENPNAVLNPHEELSWYRNEVRKNPNRGPAYVAEVDAKIQASPELRELPANLKAIIKIPVNANGNYETKHIYSLLEKGYASQDQSALDSSLVLLHVNWFDDDASQLEAKERIDHTRNEIERFKREHPNVRVATVESEWKRSDFEGKGGVIGHVSRYLNDSAVFAIYNAMEKGTIEGDNDVLLIRNDADAKGISRHYVERYIEASASDSEPDVFTGTTTFDNTKAKYLPGFVFASNFMQSINILSTGRDKDPFTAGANFGVRASAFAAVSGCGFDKLGGVGTDDVEIGRRIKSARSGQIVRTRRRGSYTYRYAVSTNESSSRRVGSRIVGARIDTDSDREQAMYENGIPMIHTWDYGFDDGGYADRDKQLSKDKTERMKEDLERDMPSIIERVRNDMEGSIQYANSRALIDTALTFAFAGVEGGATKGYRITERPDGGYTLQFTEAGKAYLANHLTRDGLGRSDPYGNRKRRQLYAQIKRGTKRKATHRSMNRI